MSNDVARNLVNVRQQVEHACAHIGRAANEVTLIAVCKGQPSAKIQAAIGVGQRDFAENYVQSWLERKEELADSSLKWHVLGRLQTNKVKKAVEGGAVLHGVDSHEVLNRLQRVAEELGMHPQIFLQVNLANESQKSGIPKAELKDLVQHAKTLTHVSVLGLMTIPPLSDDPEKSRPWFAELRGLTEEFGYLSCSIGMSHDFEVAIQEGATHIRVGTAIFGARG